MKLPHMLCCSLTVAKVFFSQSSYSVSESNGSLLVVLKTSKLHSEAFSVIVEATNGSATRKRLCCTIILSAIVSRAAYMLSIKPLQSIYVRIIQ